MTKSTKTRPAYAHELKETAHSILPRLRKKKERTEILHDFKKDLNNIKKKQRRGTGRKK